MHKLNETEALRYIIDLIYERCGIRLHDGKQHLIKARLGKRMRYHGLENLSDYCEFLQRSGDEEEITQVVDALTTNFTNFLREEDHFKFLVQTALPSLHSKGDRRIRIWSAACSTGEEPYSIGLYLSEFYPTVAGWDWKILATDISTRVLSKARLAIYPAERLNCIPREWLQRYFQKGQKNWEGHYRLKSTITERVQFEQLNLLGHFNFSQTFSVIYCRNVMIYFDRPSQTRLVNQLSRYLVPGGYLLVGHAESLTGLAVPLKCLKPSVYQKEA